MKLFNCIPLVVIFITLAPSSAYARPPKAPNTWQQIDVPNQVAVTDRFGAVQTAHPACAFSYSSADPNQPNFHFFFKPGKDDRLLVFFNGGGACWNDKTCTSSLGLGPRPTYNPSLETDNSPVGVGGILDEISEGNPFKDWNMVFIPYCTGDIHIGSKDQLYNDADGIVTGRINAPVMIQHRGFDNMMAVREWIKHRFTKKGGSHRTRTVKKLLITGSSAGAYGAKFNFPYMQGLFPRAHAYLLADAGEAGVTQGFLDEVFVHGGPWNTEETVATWLPGFNQYGNFNASNWNATLIQGLSESYPRSRIAEYSTAWDMVQTLFLNIMQNSVEPPSPGLPWPDTPSTTIFLGWHEQITSGLQGITAPNYRHYLGAGTVHTVLTNLFSTNAFYTENSANGLYFRDWMKHFVFDKNQKHWKNVSCSGDCGRPF